MASRRSSLRQDWRIVTFCPYLLLLINTSVLFLYHLLCLYPFTFFTSCVSDLWWSHFFGSVWHFVQVTSGVLFGTKANMKWLTFLFHTQVRRESKKLCRSWQPCPWDEFVWVSRCLSVTVSCVMSCGKKFIQVEGARKGNQKVILIKPTPIGFCCDPCLRGIPAIPSQRCSCLMSHSVRSSGTSSRCAELSQQEIVSKYACSVRDLTRAPSKIFLGYQVNGITKARKCHYGHVCRSWFFAA